mmetsp:Transcript_6004/g.17928  ORF Transcript_6004/g.17928 Transcript_6004/m.17928 type:complete len:245 (-) Transcript_6004:334-1068(-)
MAVLQAHESTASPAARSSGTARQHLLDQGVRDSAVCDESTAHAQLDSAGGVADLGDHAAGDGLIFDQAIHVIAAQVRQQLHLLVQHARDVREEQGASCLELTGDAPGRNIGVDVVGDVLFVAHAGSDRRNHRRDAHVQQRIEELRVDRLDFAHESQIVPVLVDLLDALQQRVVASGQAQCTAAGAANCGRDFLVDGTAEHHLRDFHDFGRRDAHAALESAFDADLFEHGIDLRSAAVHDDDADA